MSNDRIIKTIMNKLNKPDEYGHLLNGEILYMITKTMEMAKDSDDMMAGDAVHQYFINLGVTFRNIGYARNLKFD